jgi:hypothetical protein
VGGKAGRKGGEEGRAGGKKGRKGRGCRRRTRQKLRDASLGRRKGGREKAAHHNLHLPLLQPWG